MISKQAYRLFSKLFFSILLAGIIGLNACSHGTVPYEENFIGEWKSTEVRIDGATASYATMELLLKSDMTFIITTNIIPFSHPLNGEWTVDEAKLKLKLGKKEWNIHHIAYSTMRLDNSLGNSYFQIDFAK